MTTFSMKKRTRFGTWNVRTLLESSRLAQVCKEFKNYNLLILGLSELRWPDFGETTTTEGLHLLYCGKPASDTRSSGVGLLLSREAHNAVISWKPYSDRIISVRLRTRARNMTCIQCYAPTDVSEYSVKEEFYSLLDRAISSSNIGDILVVMGDFNAQIGPDNSSLENIMGTHALGRRTENGELFVNMCAANNLVIGGSLFPHKPVHKVTWVSPDPVTENQIDHITISRKWRGSLLDVRCKRGADIASDHHLVVASMRIKLAAVDNNVPTIQKKFDVIKLRNPTVASNYNNALQQSLSSTSFNQRKNWQNTKRIITDAAKAHIGYKEHIHRLVKRSARNDKRTWVSNISTEAQLAADTNRSGDLYKLVKRIINKPIISGRPIRNDDGVLITSKDEQRDLWADYYSSMLSPGPNYDPICNCTTHDNVLNISTTTPSLSDIVCAIKTLKNNKSPGNDNISPELLKIDPYTSAQILLPLVEDIWINENVPEELKEGIITMSNNRLWHLTNQLPITVEIQRRKWNWVGHTLRKSSSDIARTAIEWNQQGSRRRGRPAHTWRRQIEIDAANMHTSWNKIKNIAMNRSRWKDFVKALCSL
ncbi:uncharacterized protein LOC135955570 [Calliphora vicina]|uniref:uncharacterized protein LOC135955570 n=1 Tax=Calliphora vicina TaxID=7373 RepID=UPI00325A544D